MVPDVVVVGAGPAGSVVAEELSRHCRVLLIDAGPRVGRAKRPEEVDRRMWSFETVGGSFDWYRVRAVGGRSLIWGGWAVPFGPAVFERHAWPYGARTLRPWYARATEVLGVVRGRLDDRYRRVARELELHCSPMVGATVRGRPWTPLAWPAVRAAQASSVATHLEVQRGRGALGLVDVARGTTRVVPAAAIVLAASPIETARILLQSSLARAGAIGRGLVDHMVASYLLLEPKPAGSVVPRGPFPGCALLHDLVNTRADNRRPYEGGFSIEIGGPYAPSAFGVERMVPPGEEDRWSATQIHALGELSPHRDRYVDLDVQRNDAFGRPVPRIHVALSSADRRLAADMQRSCLAVADALAAPGSKVVPFANPLDFGAGHEAGTCAMGRDEGAPCDAWGRLRGLSNVWVADAAAMPTAGDRHPTLTVVAHALRVAHDVARTVAANR